MLHRVTGSCNGRKPAVTRCTKRRVLQTCPDSRKDKGRVLEGPCGAEEAAVRAALPCPGFCEGKPFATQGARGALTQASCPLVADDAYGEEHRKHKAQLWHRAHGARQPRHARPNRGTHYSYAVPSTVVGAAPLSAAHEPLRSCVYITRDPVWCCIAVADQTHVLCPALVCTTVHSLCCASVVRRCICRWTTTER